MIKGGPTIKACAAAGTEAHPMHCRVSLLSNLADPLELSKHPYHYCGMQKRLDLALWLYQQGVPLDSLPVASVSADGLQGTTGWTKVLNVSPKEAALLAGEEGSWQHGPPAITFVVTTAAFFAPQALINHSCAAASC